MLFIYFLYKIRYTRTDSMLGQRGILFKLNLFWFGWMKRSSFVSVITRWELDYKKRPLQSNIPLVICESRNMRCHFNRQHHCLCPAVGLPNLICTIREMANPSCLFKLDPAFRSRYQLPPICLPHLIIIRYSYSISKLNIKQFNSNTIKWKKCNVKIENWNSQRNITNTRYN